MVKMPTRGCAVATAPDGAVAGHMLVLVLFLVMSLLASAVHARAEGPTAVPNHLFAAGAGTITHALSPTICDGSIRGLRQSHSLPSLPCRSGSCCCGAVCHAPAELAAAFQLPPPVSLAHPLSFGAAAAHESLTPDMFRPPIA